jgi:SAM-dependent methyltransferase
MTQVVQTTMPVVDWGDWLRRWDAQQSLYLPDREDRFTVMLDVLEVTIDRPMIALDLACGPGSISQRLLHRFPDTEVLALDTDPVLLAIGQGVLGTRDGHLTWIKDDLTDPSWANRLVERLGGRLLDAVLSSTALHWVSPGVLADVYRALGGMMRSGGVFLNADHMDYPPHLDVIGGAARKLREQRRTAARPGAEDWETWWRAIQAEPGFAEVLAEREQRLSWRDRKWANASLDFQVGALRDAGFREVDVVWQRLNNRVLMAVR